VHVYGFSPDTIAGVINAGNDQADSYRIFGVERYMGWIIHGSYLKEDIQGYMLFTL
jgi:hypothetical protein